MTSSMLAAGTVIQESRLFTQADFNRFAALSGDDNPIHVDPDFCAATRFGRPVAHGMLLYTALYGALVRHFPGYRLSVQELMFPTPTYAGEEVIIRLEITSVSPDGTVVELLCSMSRPGGETALEGRAALLGGPA